MTMATPEPPANPPSAAPLDLDALERLATTVKADIAEQGASDAWVKATTLTGQAFLEVDAEFIAACSPDVILALVAAARRGGADTARLDWLFSDLTSDEINAKVEDVESAFMKLGRYDHDAFRAAIDAARAHPPIQETDNAESR